MKTAKLFITLLLFLSGCAEPTPTPMSMILEREKIAMQQYTSDVNDWKIRYYQLTEKIRNFADKSTPEQIELILRIEKKDTISAEQMEIIPKEALHEWIDLSIEADVIAIEGKQLQQRYEDLIQRKERLYEWAISEHQRIQQNQQNYQQMMNENNQRFYDRMAYGYKQQPTIIQPQQNSNYWQENLARQQYLQEQNQQLNNRLKPPYNPDAWKPLPFISK